MKTVAHEFGFSETDFQSIRALFVHDADSPYTILGVNPGVSDVELKAHFRKLVIENHPDKLIAMAAPPAVVKAATAKLASINAAYESVQKERANRMPQTVGAT